MSRATFYGSAFLIFTVEILTGCGQSDVPTASIGGPSRTAATTSGTTDAHEHKPGEHGGIIVALGADSYHVEAIFENNGLLRLYTLGREEARIQEVASQELIAYVKPQGKGEAVAIALHPQPQPGDSSDMTSSFVGQLPADFLRKAMDVTVPNINISGERFRLVFSSVIESHADKDMPIKVADAAEQELYLTPGGKYTEADIDANGRMTASQRFKSFKAKHDLKPKLGDMLCPVTFTKANPECSWIVGGKTYEFCCPPCVDELLSLAKKDPDSVKEPNDYIKR